MNNGNAIGAVAGGQLSSVGRYGDQWEASVECLELLRC
jgi:hypothetical protein